MLPGSVEPQGNLCYTLGLAFNEFGYNKHPLTLQGADSFTPKSLIAVLKSSVTMSTRLQRTISFPSFCLLQAGPNVHFTIRTF